MKFLKNTTDSEKIVIVYFALVFVCFIGIIAIAFGDYLKYKERIYQSDKISQCIGTSK